MQIGNWKLKLKLKLFYIKADDGHGCQ
jgi:hypothetical protein